jgi:hypothetical protein
LIREGKRRPAELGRLRRTAISAGTENLVEAAAEKSDQAGGAEKAEDEPVLNEQQAGPNRIGGEGAPAIAGRDEQTKAQPKQ